jgi:hypothetical protein
VADAPEPGNVHGSVTPRDRCNGSLPFRQAPSMSSVSVRLQVLAHERDLLDFLAGDWRTKPTCVVRDRVQHLFGSSTLTIRSTPHCLTIYPFRCSH